MPKLKSIDRNIALGYHNGFKFIPQEDLPLYIDKNKNLYGTTGTISGLFGIAYETARRWSKMRGCTKKIVDTKRGLSRVKLYALDSFTHEISNISGLSGLLEEIVTNQPVIGQPVGHREVVYHTLYYVTEKGGKIYFPGYSFTDGDGTIRVSTNELANICNVENSEIEEFNRLHLIKQMGVFDTFDSDLYPTITFAETQLVLTALAQLGNRKASQVLNTITIGN